MLFFMKILTQKSITHIEDDSMQDENEEPEVTDNILDDEDYIPDVTFQDINGEQCLRRSERQKKKKRFTDFVTYLSKVPPTTPEAEGCSTVWMCQCQLQRLCPGQIAVVRSRPCLMRCSRLLTITHGRW